jgi:hypothetical protein
VLFGVERAFSSPMVLFLYNIIVESFGKNRPF